MTEKNKLFGILILKALILSALALIIPLAPDEAQYWTWSQNLDFGYYSKPPGIAWQIASTTFLFGDNEFGVRCGTILIGFLIGVFLYKFSLKMGLSEKKSFWAAIAFALSPLGFYLSFAATTDPGSILFLLLAIYFIATGPRYLLAGFFVSLAGLFKWTAFAIWPLTLVGALFLPTLRKKTLIFGILISLFALLPTLYWNASHEWATFKHVASQTVKQSHGNFFEFLAAQIGLLSPIFFMLLVWALFSWKEKKLFYLSLFPLAVIFYLLYSFFTKIQPNWALYLYLPGFILLAWKGSEKWLRLGSYVSLFIVMLLLLTPFFPYKFNAFRQNVGWKKLEPSLSQAGYKPEQHFLFADRYQMTSLLSHYLKNKVYFFNLQHQRKNQFSYGEQMNPSQIGHDGFFVVAENITADKIPYYEQSIPTKLAPYFTSVHYCGAYPLFSVSGKPVKHALIFKGICYNGKMPENIEKY